MEHEGRHTGQAEEGPGVTPAGPVLLWLDLGIGYRHWLHLLCLY